MKEDLTLTMATLMAETTGKILKGIVSLARYKYRSSFSKVISCRTFMESICAMVDRPAAIVRALVCDVVYSIAE
jgi:hypothetical protein